MLTRRDALKTFASKLAPTESENRAHKKTGHEGRFFCTCFL
jgi:hypothetical protein